VLEKDFKLLDFGLADFMYDTRGRKKQLKTRCGTIGYLAPEMLRNSSYDDRVDVFSVGLIMYELFAGSQLFDRTNVNQKTLLKMNAQCLFTLEHLDIEPECMNLLSRLLERDPNDRISLDEALSHPWLRGRITQDSFMIFNNRDRQNNLGSSYNISRVSFS
jgi:calcium/calmodulin-dependent protein kinase I